jgi:glucan biosynthesis protein C
LTTQTVAMKTALVQPAVAEAGVSIRSRLGYIDNLRILLSILVILHHLAIGYGASGDWYYNEDGIGLTSAVIMTLFTAVNQAFFMGFFFLIAGYFTPTSFDRKGVGRYVADRLKRLGIPMVLFAVLINPPLIYALAAHDGFQGTLWQFLPRYVENLNSLGVGPLWFVEALLILSLFYALWRLLTRSSAILAQEDRKAPGNGAIALFALILGLMTFVVRLWLPVDFWLEPVQLQLADFPQYIILFAFGVTAYRRNWFAGLADAQGKLWRWIVLALIPLFLILAVAGGALDGDLTAFKGGLHWQALAYAVWEQFMCVAMISTLLVWFRTRFNHQGALGQTMSAAAYAVYVFHAPVIVLLALALSSVGLDPSLKFVLVAPVAVTLCFVVGHLIRKLPLARSIL